MLCSGISVSLLVYKSPFPQDKRGKKKQRMSKECSGETRMRGNLYCRICALMLESDTWHRLSVCFWTSEHVSTALSSVGISSGVAKSSAQASHLAWGKEFALNAAVFYSGRNTVLTLLTRDARYSSDQYIIGPIMGNFVLSFIGQ